MRFKSSVVLISLLWSMGSFAQTPPATPQVSKEPLSQEQNAVYRAVLRHYMKDFPGTLNLSDTTGRPAVLMPYFDRTCAQGLEFESPLDTRHKLSSAVVVGTRIVLVGPIREEGKNLFGLSEISFDRRHRQAIVSCSYVCGKLCGEGRVLVLEKIGDEWKVKNTCGGWIS